MIGCYAIDIIKFKNSKTEQNRPDQKLDYKIILKWLGMRYYPVLFSRFICRKCSTVGQ